MGNVNGIVLHTAAAWLAASSRGHGQQAAAYETTSSSSTSMEHCRHSSSGTAGTAHHAQHSTCLDCDAQRLGAQIYDHPLQAAAGPLEAQLGELRRQAGVEQKRDLGN